MSIDIGATITAIIQRSVVYMDGEPPTQQTLHIRDVTMQIVGMPAAVNPAPVFSLAVTDATQWNQLQVGATVTVSIYP
jgi:hypothetical protein